MPTVATGRGAVGARSPEAAGTASPKRAFVTGVHGHPISCYERSDGTGSLEGAIDTGPRRGRKLLLAAALALVASGLSAGEAQAEQGRPLLQDGAYAVEVRLELPNVLSRRPDGIATLCLPHDGSNGAPLPVLSANNPLASCPASNVERDGDVLRFDIACEGRGAARAYAVYRLMSHAFEGRIAMVMGGKNMTMTEVQSGRRIGPCDPPAAPSG